MEATLVDDVEQIMESTLVLSKLPAQGYFMGSQPSGDAWKPIRIIGHGHFGHVVLMRHRMSGMKAAMKVVPTKRTRPEYLDMEVYVYELAAEQGITHIPAIYGIHRDDRAVQLLLEFARGGDLRTAIKQVGALPVAIARRGARCLASGLHFLHSHGLVHRDVKPENVLLFPPSLHSRHISSQSGCDESPAVPDYRANTGIASRADECSGYAASAAAQACCLGPNTVMKLADFGLTKHASASKPLMATAGTLQYSAPEQLFPGNTGYHAPADMFALGLVVAQMLTGKHPYDGLKLDYSKCPGAMRAHVLSAWAKPSHRALALKLYYCKPDLGSERWAQVPPDARDFVSRCLERSAARRMTAVEALAHPWLAGCESGRKSRHRSSSVEMPCAPGMRRSHTAAAPASLSTSSHACPNSFSMPTMPTRGVHASVSAHLPMGSSTTPRLSHPNSMLRRHLTIQTSPATFAQGVQWQGQVATARPSPLVDTDEVPAQRDLMPSPLALSSATKTPTGPAHARLPGMGSRIQSDDMAEVFAFDRFCMSPQATPAAPQAQVAPAESM